MGSHGWRSGRPLAEWLRDEGYRFDFFQAVRLLERMRPNSVPLGDGSDPRRESVRLRSGLDLTFPASPVQGIETPGGRPLSSGGPLPELTANFMGVAGFVGPLPLPFSELILQRLRERDTGPRDFLDLFNHRILSLAFRIRRANRVGYERGAPEGHRYANYLFAHLGLGLPGDSLRDRLKVPDRALLRYAGLLTQRPRSLTGLCTMLSDHLRAPVLADPYVGAFRPLDQEQLTTIGLTQGRNHALGQTALLGSQIWDQGAGFKLRLGPLSYRQYQDFLPGGTGLSALCQLTRFYTGPQLDFAVSVRLRGAEIRPAGLSAGATPPSSATTSLGSLGQKGPRCLLGCCVGGAGPRLSWTSWLTAGRGGEAPARGEIEIDVASVERFTDSPEARTPALSNQSLTLGNITLNNLGATSSGG